MANGGLTFLLLPFQYLVGWEGINLVISVNSFRYQQIKSYQRRSGAVRHVEDGAECDVVDGAKSDSAKHESVRRHLAPIR